MTRSLPLALLLPLLALAPFAFAQMAREAKDVYPDFDIRDAEAGTLATHSLSSAQIQTVRQTRATMEQAQTALAARIPTLQLEMNARGTAPESIGTSTPQEFLAPA